MTVLFFQSDEKSTQGESSLSRSITKQNMLRPQNTSFVTYKELGKNGRLGNQLFQIAATVSSGHYLKRSVKLPHWNYSHVFEPNDVIEFDSLMDPIDEITKEHNAYILDKDFIPSSNSLLSLNINGYRHHPLYFESISYKIREIFTFRKEVVDKIIDQVPELKTNAVIGVHVRRGDYVGNPLYDVCDVDYFSKGIQFFKEKYNATKIIIITDDREFCARFFPNIKLSPFQTEWEDFVCLSLCNYKVISNSTFAWWAAMLDNRATSRVYCPWPWIRHPNWREDAKGVLLKNWITFDVEHNQLMTLSKPFQISLGAYYQCYKQPNAFRNVCKAFRRVYPESSLIIVSDGGDDFESMATSHFHSLSYTVNPKRTCLTTKSQAILFMQNFIQGAKQIREPWFILLEDDVYVDHGVDFDLVDSTVAIIGNNKPIAKLSEPLQNILSIQLGKTLPSSYYGGCGGSLFRTSFWSNLTLEKDIYPAIELFSTQSSIFHSDIVLSFICLLHHQRIVCGQTYFPTEFSETKPKFGESMPAILNQFKDWYV